jgi:hypothetical protein
MVDIPDHVGILCHSDYPAHLVPLMVTVEAIKQCRFCAQSIRQCGPGCKQTGWIHTETELHLCEPRKLIAKWAVFPTAPRYAYPVRIIRTPQMRVHRNDNGDGEDDRGENLGTVVQSSQGTLSNSENIQERRNRTA